MRKTCSIILSTANKYLKPSGLAHASLFLPGFLENLWNAQDFVWVSRDVSAVALALLKNYADPAKQVDGKMCSIVSARICLGKLAELTAKNKQLRWDVMVEFRWYTAVPNPDLVALGAKFNGVSTVEDFLETEVKPRLRTSGS
ncbi:hypothetical protein C8R45DRAFT_1112943 [Mycena sanguinolenta]|nr:hypothetical protein C8R45DRAFT_1112943 [Mycena sanguinolenta]